MYGWTLPLKKNDVIKRLLNIKARLERDYGREKNSDIRYNKKPLMVWYGHIDLAKVHSPQKEFYMHWNQKILK